MSNMWLAAAGLFLICLLGFALLGYVCALVVESLTYSSRGG